MSGGSTSCVTVPDVGGQAKSRRGPQPSCQEVPPVQESLQTSTTDPAAPQKVPKQGRLTRDGGLTEERDEEEASETIPFGQTFIERLVATTNVTKEGRTSKPEDGQFYNSYSRQNTTLQKAPPSSSTRILIPPL